MGAAAYFVQLAVVMFVRAEKMFGKLVGALCAQLAAALFVQPAALFVQLALALFVQLCQLCSVELPA